MRGFRASGVLILAVAAASPHATASPSLSPTPTPHPRLSGGFGQPRATATPGNPGDGGQSFADVVRAAHDTHPPSEKDARPAQKSERTGVVINNRSLVTDPSKGRITTSRSVPKAAVASHAGAKMPDSPRQHGTPVAESTTASPGAGAPAANGGASPGSPTEAEWRGIAEAARKRVTESRAKVSELEATTKKLENDFYSWDDGQYRDRVIKPAWDHSRQQLDDARAELAAAQKDLTDLPERARKAGALPGWIRE